MSLYKTLKTAASLETEGITIQYGVDALGQPITITIARSGGANVTFAKALEAATRPHRKAIQLETLDNRVADRLYLEVFAKTVVLGWTNMRDEEDNLLPFNVDNVIKVLSDLPDLYSDLREQAGKAANFRLDRLESDLGNS